MLLNIQIILSILLTIVVLLQNKSVTLNISSMSGDMWEVSKRGWEKILQNISIVLAVVFTLNGILLFITL